MKLANKLLFFAIHKRNIYLTKLAVALNANVNNINHKLETPLIKASITGNIKICDLLIKNGAKINTWDEQNCSAYYYAITHNHIYLLELLIQNTKSSAINCKLIYDNILFNSIKYNSVAAITLLIKYNINITNFSLKDNITPLDYSIERGRYHIAEVMVANGAPLTNKNIIDLKAIDSEFTNHLIKLAAKYNKNTIIKNTIKLYLIARVLSNWSYNNYILGRDLLYELLEYLPEANIPKNIKTKVINLCFNHNDQQISPVTTLNNLIIEPVDHQASVRSLMH